MTPAEKFAESHPKAVDFLKPEYESRKAEIDQAAADAGYRLAGFRLGFAVFTTEPITPEA